MIKKDLYFKCDDCGELIEENDAINVDEYYDVCPDCYRKNHKEEIKKIIKLNIRNLINSFVNGNTKPVIIERVLADKIHELAYSKEYVFIITPDDILEVIEELFPSYEIKFAAIISGICGGERKLEVTKRRKLEKVNQSRNKR